MSNNLYSHYVHHRDAILAGSSIDPLIASAFISGVVYAISRAAQASDILTELRCIMAEANEMEEANIERISGITKFRKDGGSE